MANTYKNIVITPYSGSSTNDPTITFSGGDVSTNTDIYLRVYPASNGTLSFEGTAGQLFSITNNLTGSLFSVNDISGIPSIEVFDTGEIDLAKYSGNVQIGNITTDGVSILQANGAANVASIRIKNYGEVVNSAGYWVGQTQNINRYLQIVAIPSTTALSNSNNIIGVVEIPVSGTITSIRAKTSNGTATVTFNINSSSIGSVNATTSGVSSSISSSVTALDDLTLDVSSASGSGLFISLTIQE